MTVRVTKDKINVREKLAELDKPTGQAGLEMLAADTPQEQFNLIGAGRRNLIINGAMQVAQRGTSKTGLAYGYHTADRIRSSYNGSVDTVTIRDAIVETVLSNQQVDGYTVNVLKRTYPNATDTGVHRVNYRVEAGDVAKFEGQTLTFSYYAKADVSLSFDNIWASFGGTTQYDSTQSITTAWKRYTFSFVCPAVGSSTFMDLAIGASIANLSNTSIYVTMLQLEVGNIATPFEHRSFGEELALCQRYYVQYDLDSYQRLVAVSYCDINNRVNLDIALPVPLREYVGAGQTNLTISGQAVDGINLGKAGVHSNILSGNITCPGTPLTVGTVYQVYAIGAGNFYVNGEL